MTTIDAEYVLPLRRDVDEDLSDLTGYLCWLSTVVPVTVVDGSPPPVFARHAAEWGSFLRHVAVAGRTANGKVAGVATGVCLARSERVVVADDDVRYDDSNLVGALNLLEQADLVRPQNYFQPMPWHARWDTARILLNRALGADYPGTMALRRSAFLAMGGYCGEVLFENLELIRTMRASGGRELVASDIHVARRPPTLRHFLGQRVRQAYDSLAQPSRLVVELSLLPMSLVAARSPRLLASLAACGIAVAERGRRRCDGRSVFPRYAALWAPLWLAERSLCIWLALWRRTNGGAGYFGASLVRSAHSVRHLSGAASGSDSCRGAPCACVLPWSQSARWGTE